MTDKVTTTRARKIKRKTGFSHDLLELILDRVANGESLSSICDAEDMPTRKTFFQWVKENPGIQAQYEFAIQMRADKLAEDILAIADDGTGDTYTDADGNERTNHDVVARSRLRVDARKWLASKMAPKKYGERIQQEVTGADGGPVETSLTVRFVEP